MSFKRINNITGWIVCIIACSVYIMTMEATGSFWDCGEFASSAYKLQIPHPPGAPMFVLIGRIFMAPFDPLHAATGINLMSALASGFTILFLFWTITHFARKIVLRNGGEMTGDKVFAIMAAGVVGALAYTFSDSFWFSAVEGEVYALSSFFTAVVFWAMLKWEHAVDEEHEQGIKGHFTGADRWIILIFYLMGLSIGVHLLNLLTIPAIVMIYYFKRYSATKWGTFFAFAIGCIITGVVQKAVIVWTIKGAGNFDIFFKNSVGLPFFMGFAIYFVLIGALIYFGLKFKAAAFDKTKFGIWLGVLLVTLIFLTGTDSLGIRILVFLLLLGAGLFFTNAKSLARLKLFLWCFAFMLLGYSTYFTTMVRSNANPSVDMYNVDNPVSLVGYLSREQYGDWPILYGQDFTADVLREADGYPDMKDDGPLYVMGKDRYEIGGQKQSYQYASEDMHFFPRMWDQSNDQNHADYYISFLGWGRDKNGNPIGPDGETKPSLGQNISYFMQYQVGWMYMRYFMWNFAGKQNDIQGVYMSNVRDGNWLTGISFWDNARLGDQSKLPESIRNNKANNKLFMLPFLLGLMGIIYQFLKHKKDFLVTGLLFFFTGLAIVLYLNQAGNQPRERDYAYVGSFYVFAIWIGLGMLYVKDLLDNLIKNNKMLTTGIAAAVCTLAVPVLMASQEWDDHDRSNKKLAPDLARDYLESCDKNAILVTFGDNDTYPLWYAQEVEGVRPDIRVINQSLLGTDWYINQLRYKVNESAPTDVILTADQILGSKRDQVVFNQNSGMADKPMDLYTMIKDYIGSDAPDKVLKGRAEMTANAYPTRKVTIPVDAALVLQNGTVNAKDSVVKEVSFEIPKNYLFKNDLAILCIIGGNKWKRPIYFTSPYDGLGFQDYLRLDGLTYRFVPVVTENVNKDWAYAKLSKEFRFGNADKNGVYYDEENRRHLNSIRMAYAQVADALVQDNRKDEAQKIIRRCDSMILQSNMPYGMVSRNQQHNYISMLFLQSAYACGDTVVAQKIATSLKKDLQQQLDYYASLNEERVGYFDFVDEQGRKRGDKNDAERYLMQIQMMEQRFKTPQAPPPTDKQTAIPTQAVPAPKKDSPPKKTP